MQQRRLASSGRPTGTDGSDFNYRMVVDSRKLHNLYSKSTYPSSLLFRVSKSSCREISSLRAYSHSVLLQAVFQLIGVVYTFLFTSKGEGPNVLAISSIAIGSISLILGDIGRRRSQVILLKVYMVVSSIGVLLSIACVAKGNVTKEVFQNSSNWEIRKFELLEAARIEIGFLVQIFTVSTITSLISNMSPPKRTS